MPSVEFWAGTLGLLLHHAETGCARSAAQAACLLQHLGDFPDLDPGLRHLCERASQRLAGEDACHG